MAKKRIGVIGGQGRMGSWYAQFFSNLGHQVKISDLNTPISNIELVKDSEIVIVSVPINVAVKVINEIVPLFSSDQLLMDLTSLKVKPLEAMMFSKSQVLGLHPMHGPSASSLQGQKVVACPGRDGVLVKFVLNALKENGASLKEVSAETHDKMMAFVQGLNHFSSLVLGSTIKELGIDPQESLEFASPIYEMRQDLVARIMVQDPVLYADIEIENPMVPEVLKMFQKHVNQLTDDILKKDKTKFVKVFQDTAKHFEKVSRDALEKTDKLLEYYTSRKG